MIHNKITVMNLLKFIVFAVLVLSLTSCSMPPRHKMTVKQFTRHRAIAYYIIEDDPEGVVKVLNSKGDVVVKAGYFNRPVYLKIYYTSKGIIVRHYDIDEYDFGE